MVLRDMVGEQVRSKPRYRCQKWVVLPRIRCTGTVLRAGPVNHQAYSRSRWAVIF